MNRRSQKKISKTTVSMPKELYSAGLRRAAVEGRSFSNYVQHLINKDLQSEQQAGPNRSFIRMTPVGERKVK